MGYKFFQRCPNKGHHEEWKRRSDGNAPIYGMSHDDLEQLWDHPRSQVTLKKRVLRTVLQEVIADTTDDPPTVHLKLHWAGGSHTELTVAKNRTGYHNHINSQEVTELIRELALVCEDTSIVSIVNRLGYRTGNGNTWTEKRVQHVRHTNGFPACPPARKKRAVVDASQPELLDVASKLRTALCVPALREAIKAWVAGGYKGVTDTTRVLLNHWFYTDHKLSTGAPFRYHRSQQEAIETLVFVWEFEKVRSRKALLERYAQNLKDVQLPPLDDFARHCVKMATGSGKTKVMSLAVAWQFFNAVREADDIAKDYAKTFLLLAPNVIVLERLKTDFAGAASFAPTLSFPVNSKSSGSLIVSCGETRKAPAEGMLFLTNIQQFYERADRNADEEPDEMTAILGPKPPTQKLELTDFGDRIVLRAGKLAVLNDEAHHTHDENSEWNKTIRTLHEKTPIAAQLDFSATPRFTKGAIFPWTISDYPLKQAILDNIVKRPMKGIARIVEASKCVEATIWVYSQDLLDSTR